MPFHERDTIYVGQRTVLQGSIIVFLAKKCDRRSVEDENEQLFYEVNVFFNFVEIFFSEISPVKCSASDILIVRNVHFFSYRWNSLVPCM